MLKKFFLSNLAAFSLFISNTNAIEALQNLEKCRCAGLSMLAHATTSGIINYWLNGDIWGGAVLGSLSSLNEKVLFFKRRSPFPAFVGSVIGKMGYNSASALVKKRNITSPTIPLCCSTLLEIAAFTFENYLGEKCGLTKLLSWLSLELPFPPSFFVAFLSSPLIVTSVIQKAFKLKVSPVTYTVEVLLPMLDYLLDANERGSKASCAIETSLSIALGSVSYLIKALKKH